MQLLEDLVCVGLNIIEQNVTQGLAQYEVKGASSLAKLPARLPFMVNICFGPFPFRSLVISLSK